MPWEARVEDVLALLGFSTIMGGLWNAVSYAAFVGIIVGVFSERYRNRLIMFGAAVLAVYAGVFLKNPLFATLQTLIVISGLAHMMWLRRPAAMAVMTVLTSTAYAFLYASGAIVDAWALAGSFGLLGIAFGLITLPHRSGFILMALGGVALVAYAFHVGAWVFFLLNIFFAVANIHTWRKNRGVSA